MEGKGNLVFMDVLLELGVEGGVGIWANDRPERDMLVRGNEMLETQRSGIECCAQGM